MYSQTYQSKYKLIVLYSRRSIIRPKQGILSAMLFPFYNYDFSIFYWYRDIVGRLELFPLLLAHFGHEQRKMWLFWVQFWLVLGPEGAP